MDELSTDDLRSRAFAANLRKAFGAPVQGSLPANFAVLLQRLSDVQLPYPPQSRDSYRLGM
jgi:hypothetical protein